MVVLPAEAGCPSKTSSPVPFSQPPATREKGNDEEAILPSPEEPDRRALPLPVGWRAMGEGSRVKSRRVNQQLADEMDGAEARFSDGIELVVIGRDQNSAHFLGQRQSETVGKREAP